MKKVFSKSRYEMNHENEHRSGTECMDSEAYSGSGIAEYVSENLNQSTTSIHISLKKS